MSHVYERAATKVLQWLHLAEDELVGRAVVTFNGEAGTVHELKLDEHHGMCFTIDPATPSPHYRDGRRFYPVSTIRMFS